MSQQKEVKQINLNSNVNRVAKYMSTQTVNPWGITAQKKFIYTANNGSLTIGKYNRKGKLDLAINTTGAGTGLVSNFKSSNFQGASLILVTESGTIEIYKPSVDPANTAVVLTVPNGILKGVTIAKNKLYVANFADIGVGGGNVIIYDSNFNFLSTFTDADLIAEGYYPYNVYAHKKLIYVAFALKDGSDGVKGEGFGYIDVFKLDGTFVKRLVNRTGLNEPWGLLVSKCDNYLLVGNFGDGTISIYDRKCGDFIGQVRDCYCNILYIDGLWGIYYDVCNDDILFAAGIDDEANGLIGRLTNCCEKSSSKSCKSSSSSSSSSKCCH
ncbi:MAG TPA: TIGR03118 family protein [Candidatus Saccharimonadales bacterium]|nr:TIGR03118 family protein [Candidatus Saccharimonadales bacterium]